jgi:hypothetical protein
LRDLGDPLRSAREALLAVANLAADRQLVIEMTVAQALQARDLGGDPGLAHEPFTSSLPQWGQIILILGMSGLRQSGESDGLPEGP